MVNSEIEYKFDERQGIDMMLSKNVDSDKIQNWRKRVDCILRRRYSLTIELAGLSEEQICDYYQPELTPNDFVEWFAEKYDLYDFRSFQ